MNRTERCVALYAVSVAAFVGAQALKHHSDPTVPPPDPTLIAPGQVDPLAQLGPFNSLTPKGPYKQENFYGVYQGDEVTKLRIFTPKPGRHEVFSAHHNSTYEDLVLIYSPALSKELKKSIGKHNPGTERAILLTGTHIGTPDERISASRLEFDKRTKRVTFVGDAEFMKNKNDRVLPSNRVVRALGYTITGNVIHRHKLLAVDLRVNDRKAEAPKRHQPHASSPPKAPLPGAPAPIPAYPLPGEGIYI